LRETLDARSESSGRGLDIRAPCRTPVGPAALRVAAARAGDRGHAPAKAGDACGLLESRHTFRGEVARMLRKACFWLLSLALLPPALTSCGTQNGLSYALELNPPRPREKRLQMRRFDDVSREEIFFASAEVLEELGYEADVKEVSIGTLVASRKEPATAPGGGSLAVGIFSLFVNLASVAATGSAAIKDPFRSLPATPKKPSQSRQPTAVVSMVIRPAAGTDGRSHLAHVIFRETDTGVGVGDINYWTGNESQYKRFFGKLSELLQAEAHEL